MPLSTSSRPSISSRLAALATVAVLMATAAPLAAQAAPTASPATGAAVPVPSDRLDWGPCTDADLANSGAECARVTVPLDHRKPSGRTISLAVSRVRHTVPDADYQGVMLVNPGGPGASGLVFSLLGGAVPGEAAGAYDWIGLDPRGVGESEPRVSCDPTYAGFDRPRYAATSAPVSLAWKRRTSAYTSACDRRGGAILDHLTTADSARDLDRVRAALGVRQISLYGFSWGTYLGQVYATLFPTRLRRAVLDGTVDPRTVWYRTNLAQDAGFDANLEAWFAWVARYDDVYHLGTSRTVVRQRFYATQERLYATPARGERGLLGGSEWTDTFLAATYYQAFWPDLATTFDAFVNERDVDALEQAYTAASGYGDDNGYAVYLGTQCTDTAWPSSWRAWRRDTTRAAARAPFYAWANAWYNEPCRHWPAKAQRPVTVSGKRAPSVLLVNETRDAATPYAGSLEVRRRFPHASLVAVAGGTSHANSLTGNDCVDSVIARYLLTGDRPARRSGNRADLTCAAAPPPDPTLLGVQSRTARPTVLEQLRQRGLR